MASTTVEYSNATNVMVTIIALVLLIGVLGIIFGWWNKNPSTTISSRYYDNTDYGYSYPTYGVPTFGFAAPSTNTSGFGVTTSSMGSVR